MEQDLRNMEDRAKHAASAVQDSLHDAAASAEQMAKRAGDAVESAADRVREYLPEEGSAAEAADAVARKVKDASLYFQEQGFSGVVEDLEVLIRRYPIQALLFGLGCGYLLSRVRTD